MFLFPLVQKHYLFKTYKKRNKKRYLSFLNKKTKFVNELTHCRHLAEAYKKRNKETINIVSYKKNKRKSSFKRTKPLPLVAEVYKKEIKKR